jgi:hypothetical protein
VPDSTVTVRVPEKPDSVADISFINFSQPIPRDLDIFARGAKGDIQAEGFGYGLYWGRILVDYYNRQLGRTMSPLELTHTQTLREGGLAEQVFILANADVKREE